MAAGDTPEAGITAGKKLVKKRRKVARKERLADAPGDGEAAPREEEEEEEEENPGLLLADLVAQSGNAAPKLRKAPRQGRRRPKRPQPLGENEDIDMELPMDDEEGGDGDDEAAGSRLIEAMGQLSSGAEQTSSAAAASRKFSTEGRPESEFHAGGGGEAITVDDLLAPLAETTGFGTVRKQLESLARAEPLPETASETTKCREERTAQYESSCRDAAKWIPQIQQMRRADQVVLGKDDDQDTRPISTASLVDTFKATDDFEKELEQVTMAAGATEKDVKGGVELPMNSRIHSEKERQAGAKLKSLLLREQQSAKRIKKIKSKTYRRIHRKAETREKEVLLERLERENPELAKTLKLEYERKHAQMRLQRQRNARKKWAQTMNRFAKGDKNAQKEMTKQAQKAHDEEQALRRAIRGKDPDKSDDSEAVDLSDSDSEEEGQKQRGVARQTISKAKKLTVGELKSLEKEGDLPTTGLLGMNFMRNAIQQKREHAKKEALGVLGELEGLHKSFDAAEDSDTDVEGRVEAPDGEALSTCAAGSQGKKTRAFTAEELAAASAQVDVMLQQEDGGGLECSVSGPLTVKGVAAAPLIAGKQEQTAPQGGEAGKSRPSREPKRSQRSATAAAPQAASDEEVASNPWLNTDLGVTGFTVASSSRAAAPSISGGGEDGATPSAPNAKAVKGKKRKKKGGDDVADGDAEVQAGGGVEDLLSMLNADSETAREQRALVRTAFVEGTQAEDFDAEQDELEKKKEDAREDSSKELPGWGSWTGEGVVPRKPKKVKEIMPLATQRDQRRQARVQLYEGNDAEPTKYFIDQMPYPFQSPDQHEQLMRQPLGKEWNALPSHFQKIKPKFFSKVGAIVPPLQYVKHLPSEHRDSALKTWAAAKQPKRLKAKI